MGLSARLEASASATGRSQAVSVTSRPPTRFTNTSCSCRFTPAWRFMHGQQHRDALRIETLRDAPRRAEAHAIHQRLQLDQQRPTSIARHRDDAAGRRLGRTRQENRRRVAHLAQPLLAHVEERELTHRAEAVLGGAHVAKTARRVAFEIQHRVDQVFERARTGDRAVLGHVPDDDDARPGALREAHELRRAFLAAASRRRPACRPTPAARSGSNRRPAAARFHLARAPASLRDRCPQPRAGPTPVHRAVARARRSGRPILRRTGTASGSRLPSGAPPAAAAWICRFPARRLARSPIPE